MEYIALFAVCSTMVICMLSSVSDMRSLNIPNWHSLAIVGLFLPVYLIYPEGFFPVWQHIVAMVLMFVVSYIMFHFNVMGGGDSKLATAVSLWLGLKLMLPFMFFMSISGGVLGVTTILIRKFKPFKKLDEKTWFYKAQQGVNEVPYGIAITVGYLFSIFHIPLMVN